MARVRYSFGSRHTGRIANIAKQRGKYPQVMKDVIAISDIILQILDARYITQTRNKEIEKDITAQNKKILYVFNKADLIKKTEIPVAVIRRLKPHVFVSAKTGNGAKELRERIRIEAKRVELGDKKRVHVGVIGYPNAGKSSIINLLARKKAASTSRQAGHTKGMQKIRLTQSIHLLDTPGVIPETLYSTSAKKAMVADTKVGARTYNNVKDPEDVVHHLFVEHKKSFETFYQITGDDSDSFIELLGTEKKFLKKKGAVDTDRTARLILRDWQEGKITRA